MPQSPNFRFQDESYPEEERTKVLNILQANKSKPFVRRMLELAENPDSPFIPDPKTGERQTHRMATMEEDGRGLLFPLVQEGPGGRLRQFKKGEARKALAEARKNGNVMEFPTEADAAWFEQRWKSALGLF